ncbi:MAG: alkaline phosphatase family protein [Acidobacteria bacterium]|nr:alkaline phosphatase family protein [Acidobacteriota bacterium]
MLISISGLRADLANDPESFRLKIPNIQSLKTKGSYAVGIESVYPSQTIPAHTSMVTGVLPADHSITSDYPFDEQTGMQSAEAFQSAKAIKTDKIWEAAKRENLTTAAVGFPMTMEADIAFNFPEARDEADSAKAERAISLIEKSSPNLLLLNFTSLAAAQHRFGLLSAEAKLALEQIDGLVGKIVASVERAQLTSETTFLIASDQGASRVEREFRPNILLAKKGFLTTDGKGVIKDWRAVAQSFDGSAAIFLKNPQDESAMHEIEALFTEFDQNSDNPLWRIISRREAIRLGANPRPALYLDAAPTFQISARVDGSMISKTNDRAAHGYLPSRAEMRATLILSGKQIKQGQRIEYGRLIDIAPTIARLLGLEMKSARGRVFSEAIAQ